MMGTVFLNISLNLHVLYGSKCYRCRGLRSLSLLNAGTYADPGDDLHLTLSASLGTVIDNFDGTWLWERSAAWRA